MYGLDSFLDDLLPLAGHPLHPPQPAPPPQPLARRQSIAPIQIPKRSTALPLDQLPFDQLPLGSADLQLSIYEASLKMPEAPKPIEPTKTGRRRRMIPLKHLDHQVLSLASLNVGYNSCARFWYLYH